MLKAGPVWACSTVLYPKIKRCGIHQQKDLWSWWFLGTKSAVAKLNTLRRQSWTVGLWDWFDGLLEPRNKLCFQSHAVSGLGMVWWLQRPGHHAHCTKGSFSVHFWTSQHLSFHKQCLKPSWMPGISGISITDPDNEELELGKVGTAKCTKTHTQKHANTHTHILPTQNTIFHFNGKVYSRAWVQWMFQVRSGVSSLQSFFRSVSITTVEHTSFACGEWGRLESATSSTCETFCRNFSLFPKGSFQLLPFDEPLRIMLRCRRWSAWSSFYDLSCELLPSHFGPGNGRFRSVFIKTWSDLRHWSLTDQSFVRFMAVVLLGLLCISW